MYNIITHRTTKPTKQFNAITKKGKKERKRISENFNFCFQKHLKKKN